MFGLLCLNSFDFSKTLEEKRLQSSSLLLYTPSSTTSRTFRLQGHSEFRGLETLAYLTRSNIFIVFFSCATFSCLILSLQSRLYNHCAPTLQTWTMEMFSDDQLLVKPVEQKRKLSCQDKKVEPIISNI